MKVKIFTSIILIITFFGLLMFIWNNHDIGGNLQTFAMLDKYLNENPAATDYFDSIGFDGTASDVKLFCDDEQKELEIRFGDVSLKFDREELNIDRNIELLEKIGLKFKKRKKDGRLILYWRNQKISEYVK